MSAQTNLQHKTILLGVTGGIAAYKIATLASLFIKSGATVEVIMTEAAEKFITPLTFEAITHRRVHTSMWQRHEIEPHHIALAERLDLALVAPATANTIAKLTYGIADNLLTSVLLATTAPLLVAPAMNDNMYKHPATQDNLDTLIARGVLTAGPVEGRLASGKIGTGRMAEPADIFAIARTILTC